MFTDQDYNSNDGMLTAVWGPSLWHVLHTISFNYPTKPSPEDKQKYKDFLLSLGKVLPCKYCRDNFAKNLVETNFSDDVLENRNNFSRFIYNLHNQVNKALNKESKLTYEDVRDRYENFRARCVNDVPLIPKHADEKGCTIPLYGKKSRCILRVVPSDSDMDTFAVDDSCVLRSGREISRIIFGTLLVFILIVLSAIIIIFRKKIVTHVKSIKDTLIVGDK